MLLQNEGPWLLLNQLRRHCAVAECRVRVSQEVQEVTADARERYISPPLGRERPREHFASTMDHPYGPDTGSSGRVAVGGGCSVEVVEGCEGRLWLWEDGGTS
jgi:hypothetical protein